MSRSAIERAIRFYGTQDALAAAVGKTQHCIWRAKEVGRCSPELAIKIEIATSGKVRKEELAAPEAFRLPKPLRRRARVGA
jgi:DNA-binding transcriptional regulator YdaS (Cro superfamily)